MKRWTVSSAADLGRAISDVRQLRLLSQAQLAEQTGIDRTYLAKLEAGASSLLLERALRLLRRLGANVTVTFDEPDELEDRGAAHE